MFSAFCIAAPHSSTGKTTLSMGLMRLLSRQYLVQPFKCGPDYIDTSYHKIACQRFSYNLDSWLMGEKEVKTTFFNHITDCDIAIIEGVMGLFDGKQQNKKEKKHDYTFIQNNKTLPKNLPPLFGSTAHIAQILDLPILMIIDCKGMAQSISAIVRGFQAQCHDYGLKLCAVIANNVGSERHFTILKESLGNWNLPPLLGYIPKNLITSLKERQLGLPHLFESEKDTNDKITKELNNNLDKLADILTEHIDIEKLLTITAYSYEKTKNNENKPLYPPKTKHIAIAYDKAFCFYYRQNLELLENKGYKLHYFSPLADRELPKADALYLGGGYPEIYAKELSKNTAIRTAIKDFAENDGQIFAECGGFIYLCSSLKTQQPYNKNTTSHKTNRIAVQADQNIYPLCNVIDAEAIMGNRLQSLGYREGKFLIQPFFLENCTKFRGHEFHWSDIILHKKYAPFLEINNTPIGISYKNVRASYIHFYFANQQKDTK